ncbi:MAG: hypothetical protein DIU55_010115 [Bacillota bacterium]
MNTTSTRVIGLDLSLTATGIADAQGDRIHQNLPRGLSPSGDG